jgi:cell division protein ZapA
MCKIRDGGKVKARDRIAVLSALNLAFDLSERNSAAAPEPAVPPAGSRPEPTDSEPDAQVAALLDRIDAALGEDGRLL